MGCGMSSEEKQGKQRNEEIDNQLKRDKLSQRNEIKMLLLGEKAIHRSQTDTAG
jgi:guanine nucleotide-binding protein subunit alpha